jgi:hypothetical protein
MAAPSDPRQPVFTSRNRRQLMQRTQHLGSTEHAEIFKLLEDGGVNHTENNNGVFVNLSSVPDDVMWKVQHFVDFCYNNKRDLDEYDKRINECKLNQNFEKMTSSVCESGASAGADGAGADGATPATVVADDTAKLEQASTTQHPFASAAAVAASIAKRLVNSKFHQAKKKYAKKRVVDKKNDMVDMASHDLYPEPYLVGAQQAT